MNSRRIKTFIVDSFTGEPFKGNPAGVCLCDEPLEPDQMLAIARELNLSETAFVGKANEDDRYSIRYFSPKMEIPLCGHATLAAAKVLFETAKLEQIQFSTIGMLELTIRLAGEEIEMEFPVYELLDDSVPDSLLTALGVASIEYCGYNEETRILMLEISSASELAELRPDFNALLSSHDSIRGVLVTARAEDEFDFHSRYFWPWSGTNEDQSPVEPILSWPSTGETNSGSQFYSLFSHRNALANLKLNLSATTNC